MPIHPRHIPDTVKLSPGPREATFTPFTPPCEDEVLERAAVQYLRDHCLVTA